ncbi:MAG: NAD(P)-dependent oxidoreductase [Cyanobacteria bacterium P01_D01_bin.115]
MSRIAILGTGAMGSRIAQNLLNAQHSVVVYNRTAERVQPLVQQGATFAASPRVAADQADFVISMVTDDQASRSVWLDVDTGAAATLGEGAIAIESSTLTVEWVKELGVALYQQGTNFLDAPMVGSRPQAEAGKLTYLVGGDDATRARSQAVLSDAGAAQVYALGAVGQGTAMKLAVNALFGIQVAALAEVLNGLAQQGLSYDAALDCLGELPIMSPAAKLAAELMRANTHAPLFPIALVEKDFRYGVQSAQAVKAKTPITAAVGEVYRTAIAQGYADDNITGIIQSLATTLG